MFKKIMVLMSALLILFGGILSTSFDSFAEGTSNDQTFRVTYPEPSTGETQGYFSLMAYDSSTGIHRLNTYFWNIQPYETGNSNISDFTVTMEVIIGVNNLIFIPNVEGAKLFSFSFCEFGSDDQLYVYKRGVYSMDDVDKNYSYTRPDSSVYVGCIFNGNVGGVTWGNTGVAISTPEVYFSQSVDTESLYNRFYDVIAHIDDLNSDVVAELGDILTSTRSLESKLDALIELQEESNTWLEKIYNFFAEKDEKDKEAAIQQGNQSTSDVDNIIQDDSEGFKDSLGGLASSMSYSGTECSWTFPTMKLPTIPGVMDEVTLLESQEIDFAFWINSLPADLLLLIRSLFTSALIIFCFKELYGIVSYALTLRGGGNNE